MIVMGRRLPTIKGDRNVARVNKIVWDDSHEDGYREVPTEVKVGDYVCFKSDVEQSGRITRIDGNNLELSNDNGFSGGYIGGRRTTWEHASDCWLED
jgi:hypothetical protein